MPCRVTDVMMFADRRMICSFVKISLIYIQDIETFGDFRTDTHHRCIHTCMKLNMFSEKKISGMPTMTHCYASMPK